VRLTASIEFRESISDHDEYFALFESTGWNKEYCLTPEQLQAAVLSSWRLLAAYENGELVGTGRVISDGAFHALIVDVMVTARLRRQGLGAVIVERLLESCREAGLRDVQLFCARGQAPFYRRLGFRERPAEAPGMEFKPA